MDKREKFEIFQTDYEIMIEVIKVDLTTGQLKKTEGYNDEDLNNQIISKHDLEESATIIYTDSSKKKKTNLQECSYRKPENSLQYQYVKSMLNIHGRSICH